MRVSNTDRRMQRVEVAWQQLQKENGGEAATALEGIQLIWKQKCSYHLQRQGLTAVHLSRVPPQESWLPQRKWKVCSWVSVPCGSPGKTVPRSQRRQSQSNSWCLWQANQLLFLFPCWLAVLVPKAPLRRKKKTHLRTQLEDSKRYQPTFISVSFPHLRSAWGLTRALVLKMSLFL